MYEQRLAKYLMTRTESVEEMRVAARIAWNLLNNADPQRLALLGMAQPGDTGGVGDDPRVLGEVVRSGNLRELFSVVQSAATDNAMEGILPTTGRFPEIVAERPLRITTQARPTWQRPSDVWPPLSQAERAFNVWTDPATRREYLLWERAEDSKSLPFGAPLHINGDLTGGLVSTGTSGSTALVLDTVHNLGQAVSREINMAEIRLAILGFHLAAGHHSLHEVMRAAEIWDAKKGHAYGFGYQDGWARYRNIAPLSEDELRRNVAVNGLFPDEIAFGILPPEAGPAVVSGIDMLRGRGINPAVWETQLLRDAQGRQLAAPGSPLGRTLLQQWSRLWSAQIAFEVAREEAAALRPVGTGPATGRFYQQADVELHRRGQALQLVTNALTRRGHDPAELRERLMQWLPSAAIDAARQRARAQDLTARVARMNIGVSTIAPRTAAQLGTGSTMAGLGGFRGSAPNRGGCSGHR